MSTSPDTQKGEPLATSPSSTEALLKPTLILLKGILYIALVIGAITVLALNYEIIWDLIAEFVPLVFEVIEETLDTFFEKVVRLNPMFAQMATAYSGFVIFLALLYLLIRKGTKAYRKAKTKKAEISHEYARAWAQWSGGIQEACLKWWNSLDTINKIVAAVAFVLLGVPLALLLSYVLGSLVVLLAEML